MIRRVVPAILLVVLVATAVLWARSCVYMESIVWGYAAGQRQFTSVSGTLFYSDWENPNPSSTGLPMTYTRHPAYAEPLAAWSELSVKFLGFLFTWRTPTSPTFQIGIPHGFVCLAISSPFLRRIARFVRARRRRARGACMSCGYDLAGNVSGACPECGEST